MTSVTMTIAKKKAIEATVGLPSVVSMGAAVGSAVSRAFKIAPGWNMGGSPRAGCVEKGLALQRALEPLALGVVRLVRPGHVERGERPGEHDGGDAERDRQRRDLADPLRHELLRGGDED